MGKRYKIGKALFTISWIVLGILIAYLYSWLVNDNVTAKSHVFFGTCAWVGLLSVGKIFMRNKS